MIIVIYCASTYVNCTPGATPVSKQDEENYSIPFIFAVLGPQRSCTLMIFMSDAMPTATGLMVHVHFTCCYNIHVHAIYMYQLL